MMIKRLFLILAGLLAFADLRAQVDLDFWIALPPHTIENDIHLTYDYYFVSNDTYFNPATVEITTYYINTTTNSLDSITSSIDIDFNNQAGHYMNIPDIERNLHALARTFDFPLGVHITSTAPISCRFWGGDMFFPQGTRGLGTQFLIPIPDILPEHSIQSNIELVATHDSTIVKFTPSADLSDGTSAGQTVTLQLRRGESFWAQASSLNSNQQLGGSTITSNYPIAVYTTSTNIVNPDFPTGGSSVSISDQILPEESLGLSYAIVSNGINTAENADYASIYATADNTVVTLNGTALSLTLNRGDHLVVLLPDTVNLLQANHPLAVFHTLCRAHEYGGSLAHPLGCGGTNMSKTFIPLASEYYIVVPTAHTEHFCLAGLPADLGRFRPVPGDSSYSWMIYPSRNSNNTVISNDSCAFQFCDIYRFMGRSYVTYPSTFANPTVPYYRLSNTSICLDDVIRFDLADHNLEQIQIQGPDNIHLFSPDSLSLTASDTNLTGWYYISGTTAPDCHNKTYPFFDSVYISILRSYNETLYDTIVENQLPWTYHGSTFDQPADTILTIQSSALRCDSIFDYHLFVYPNIYDTIIHYICDSELPFVFLEDTLTREGTLHFVQDGMHGEDSNIIVQLHIVASSEAYIFDTIVESQLPWHVLDTIFTDTVDDYLYTTYNEAGCDSLVHYSLYIFWEGDHCDTSLSFANVVTPNGDGKNDRFVIDGLLENKCFSYNELTILGRDGITVYHKRNISSEADWWDPAAHHIPDGTYFFIFKAHGVNIRTMRKGVIEVLSK